MADLALNIRIKAFDETKGTIKGLRGDLGGGRGGMRRQGAAAKRTRREVEAAARGVANMGRAAEGLLRGPIEAATRYETSLADIRTLTDEAKFSTDDLRRITQDASKEFGGSSSEQAGALYDIISAGAKNAEEAQGTLAAANKLSIGGLTDVGNATQAISATTANFRKEGIDAAKASDLLFSIVKKGRTTLDQTARAFPKVASAAGGIKLPAAQAAGAFATLTLTTKSSAVASTQLAALIGATAKPTEQATGALALLNKEREKEDDLAGRKRRKKVDIGSSALRDLGVAGFAAQFEGIDDNTLARLFGSKQARSAIVAFRDNISGLESAISDAENSSGAATKAFETQSNTRAQRLKRLESQLDGAKLALGEAIAPVVDSLTPSLVGIAGVVSELSREYPGVAKAGGALAIATVGVGKLGQGIVGLTTTVTAMRDASSLAVAGINGVNSKLGKAGLVASAAAAGFAIGTLVDDLFGFSDKISNFFAGTSEEKRATTRGGVGFAEKKLITDASGKEITDPAARAAAAKKASSRLMRGGTVKGDVTAALYNEGFTAKDIEASYGIGPARSRRSGSAEQVGSSKIDVKVSVEDGRIKVNSVTSSNHEGEVNATTGDGVGLN
jgi:TP901 family phage tail tape measure protein